MPRERRSWRKVAPSLFEPRGAALEAPTTRPGGLDRPSSAQYGALLGAAAAGHYYVLRKVPGA